MFITKLETGLLVLAVVALLYIYIYFPPTEITTEKDQLKQFASCDELDEFVAAGSEDYYTNLGTFARSDLMVETTAVGEAGGESQEAAPRVGGAHPVVRSGSGDWWRRVHGLWCGARSACGGGPRSGAHALRDAASCS